MTLLVPLILTITTVSPIEGPDGKVTVKVPDDESQK